VRDALVSLALQAGVQIRFEALVIGLDRAEDAAWHVRLAGGESIQAARVILASGGLSVPKTGSDGTGLAIARRLGHTINSTYPALTPLLSGEAGHAALAGVSVRAAIDAAGATRARAEGGVLFTHRGYSGPAVLDVSHVAVRALDDPVPGSPPARIVVRWSALDGEAWGRQLQVPARRIGALLREQLPARLATALMAEAGLAPDSTTSELRRASRLALIERLTRYVLPCNGHEGYAKAEVTGGGVALGEVHPITLESRIAPGVHLCGEMLDAFGPIGGHNFAWAWSTGRLAGIGAADRNG
jgi:predicted Rossmann fold flavoprotein